MRLSAFRSLAGRLGRRMLALGCALAFVAPVFAQNPPYMVHALRPGIDGSTSPSWLNVIGNDLYFNGYESMTVTANGISTLLRTDGTAAGTVNMGLHDPYHPLHGIHNMIKVNGVLYFTLQSPAGLWRIAADGTPTLVKAISIKYQLGAAGTTIFFDVWGSGVTELWKSDGTEAGTVSIGSFSEVWLMPAIGGTLYFTVGTSGNTHDLWKSDGTPAGTVKVATITPYIYAAESEAINGLLYFQTSSGLWVSDGTAAGTLQLPGGTRDVTSSQPGSKSMAPLGNLLIYRAERTLEGCELWKTDGTPAGTSLVKDIYIGNSSYPEWLTAMGGYVYFTADDGMNLALWRTDGTAAGTTMVKDVSPMAGFANINQLKVAGGTLYFGANDGTHGIEPWKSDGTAAGTVMISDLTPGPNGSAPADFTLCDNRIFFGAIRPNSTTWRSLYALDLLGRPVPQGRLAVSPTDLRFDDSTGRAVNVVTGGSPTFEFVTIANMGNTNVTLTGGGTYTGLAITGSDNVHFRMGQVNGAPASNRLLPGERFEASVIFDPQSSIPAYNLTAFLTVTSDSVPTPSLTVHLSGDATPVGLSSFTAH